MKEFINRPLTDSEAQQMTAEPRHVKGTYLPAEGKLNRSQRRALAKLQRKDEKLSRKIKQLESNLKRKPR